MEVPLGSVVARAVGGILATAVKRLPGYNILTTFNIGVGDDPR
jgi:hypothetical protein